MPSNSANVSTSFYEEIGSLLSQLTEPSQELHNVALIIADLIIQNKNHLLMVINQQ
jgi:PhoPQ-activated pathogenicity-related protein